MECGGAFDGKLLVETEGWTKKLRWVMQLQSATILEKGSDRFLFGNGWEGQYSEYFSDATGKSPT